MLPLVPPYNGDVDQHLPSGLSSDPHYLQQGVSVVWHLVQVGMLCSRGMQSPTKQNDAELRLEVISHLPHWFVRPGHWDNVVFIWFAYEDREMFAISGQLLSLFN